MNSKSVSAHNKNFKTQKKKKNDQEKQKSHLVRREEDFMGPRSPSPFKVGLLATTGLEREKREGFWSLEYPRVPTVLCCYHYVKD